MLPWWKRGESHIFRLAKVRQGVGVSAIGQGEETTGRKETRPSNLCRVKDGSKHI